MQGRETEAHLIKSALSAKLGIKTKKEMEKPANLLDGKKMGNESLRPLPGPATAKDVSIQIADLPHTHPKKNILRFSQFPRKASL